jgi:predicted nucleic acid-binding protein
LLNALPSVGEAEHSEVLGLVEDRGLAGLGLGWVDAHLLASALLGGSKVWTLDRPLASAAASLGIGPD